MRRPKVLYLCESMYPSMSASALQNVKMSEAFAELGFDVTLVTFSGKSADTRQLYESIKKSYRVESDFKLVSIDKPHGFRSSILAWAKQILRARLKDGDLVFTRALHPAYVANLLRKNVIIELHKPHRIPRTILKNGQVKERPIKNIRRDEKILRKVGQGKYTLAYVVINEFLKDYCESHPSIDSTKVRLARTGANYMSEITESVQLLGDHPVNIGYTGRLFTGKGMEVISKLAVLCPEFGFHIVGGTEDEVEGWKKKTINAPNLFYYGYRPHYQIPGFLKEFDMVLLPNQADVVLPDSRDQTNIGRSTSPLKCFEYMAAGKIIIASNVPALAEILEHGRNAYLCHPEAVEEWEQAVNDIAANYKQYRRLGEQAYSEFISQFTLKEKVKGLLLELGCPLPGR